MKRYVVILLSMVFVIGSLSVPALAADDNENFDSFFDLLGSQSSGNRSGLVVDGRNSGQFQLEVPGAMLFRYIEFTIVSSAPLTSVIYSDPSNGSISCTINLVSSTPYVYKGYASLNNTKKTYTCNLSFTASAAGYVELTACYISVSHYLHSKDVGSYKYSVNGSTWSDLYSQDSYGSPVTAYFSSGHDYTGTLVPVTLYLYCDKWKNYDYLDYHFSARCTSIDSISVDVDGISVPFEFSFSDVSELTREDFSSRSDYECSLRIDLRGIDRSAAVRLNTHISLHYDESESSNRFSLQTVRGYTLASRQVNWMVYGIYTLQDVIFTAASDIDDYIGMAAIDIVSSISDLTDTVVKWGCDLWTAISYGFEDVINSISENFSGLKIFLTDLLDPTESTEASEKRNEFNEAVDSWSDLEASNIENMSGSFDVAHSDVTAGIASLGSTFLFIQTYLTGLSDSISDYLIVFTFPIFLGIFMFLVNRLGSVGHVSTGRSGSGSKSKSSSGGKSSKNK